MKLKTAIFVVLSFFPIPAWPQGTFQNLNFEQANPVSAGDHFDPYAVTAASALPYWTVTIGGVQQTAINYNYPSTGAPAVMLAGPDYYPGYAPIDGNYSVLLTGSFPTAYPSISQTGLIPAGTQSLLFEAEPIEQTPIPGPLEVLVGTQVVPFSAVGTGPNYTLYGANISAWAGETEQLTFSALEDGLNNWMIDDISFSPNSVTPEPGTLMLILMGGVATCARRGRINRS